MAPDGVEEAEYESDPEQLLATRRREASDDEDEDDGVKEGEERLDIESYDEEEDCDDDMADHDKTSDAVVSQPKHKEPFAVPTAGAFYMHDDRFQEMDASPNRPMPGARRLWLSRDERKWGHDKYEDMSTPDKKSHRRTSRGRARGRGQDRGHSRRSNSTTTGHQIQSPKAVTRGRAPRRYEVASRNDHQSPAVQIKQSLNSFVKVSHVDSGREPTETASIETEALQAKKNLLASSLNSASPPFYPSGSSNNLAQKDLQAGMARLHINGNPTLSGKKFGNAKSSSSWVRTNQPSQTTSQGRDAPHPGKVLNQGGTDQRGTQPPGQAFDQHSAVISLLPPSPPKCASTKIKYISVKIEPAAETGALVAREKGTLQRSGRGSFIYGGTQFMGAGGSMATAHGNPNFPAFLPVMQFGGQPGGVPTFGMALPGYVQPEHGTGNPEMTWLPILTGPGALGASYSPPYATMDGSYQAHKPGLPSSAGSSSQENSSSNPNDEEKPVERPEATNNGTSQWSNSNPSKQPRRYSEMSFSK